MKLEVMSNQCGRVLDLMASSSFVVNEDGKLKSYNFCSEQHMAEFARRKGMTIGKD